MSLQGKKPAPSRVKSWMTEVSNGTTIKDIAKREGLSAPKVTVALNEFARSNWPASTDLPLGQIHRFSGYVRLLKAYPEGWDSASHVEVGSGYRSTKATDLQRLEWLTQVKLGFVSPLESR